MTRKQLQLLLSETAALADRLSESDHSLNSREVSELLEESGYDPEELMGRLRTGAKAIATRLRQSSKPVPRHVLRVIDNTGDLGVLATCNPAVALSRLRQSLRDLASVASKGVLASCESVVVARAYRKTAELSPDDEQLLDEIEQDLKTRMATPDKDGDSGQG